MQKQRKIPLRQCIACRELKEKKAMLRVVKNSAGEIFLDFSGKAAGRGAYVCDQPDCITKLKAKRMSALDHAQSPRGGSQGSHFHAVAQATARS